MNFNMNLSIIESQYLLRNYIEDVFGLFLLVHTLSKLNYDIPKILNETHIHTFRCTKSTVLDRGGSLLILPYVQLLFGIF